jgi:hypothetical protein
VINLDEQQNVVFMSYNMVLTIPDGKMCKDISSTPFAQVCYVCGAALKQMNRIGKIVENDVELTCRFRLSTLQE